ncbi:MAG: hypothetical protein IJ213_10025, partial [Bacteroidales bacterium]|nr:hypothetical protein [Bacteroidales bacterium]
MLDNALSNNNTITHGDNNTVSYQTTKEYKINKTLSTITPKYYYYDVLDRDTMTIFSDNTKIQKNYDFGTEQQTNLLRFKTSITDQNGNTSYLLTDYKNNKLQITDALNNTTKIIYKVELTIDPEGYATIYTYDQIGRLVKRKNTSSGVTKWDYDMAGNLTKQTFDDGEYIDYGYYYNQLKKVSYSNRDWNNVWYEYGQTGEGNNTGRVTRQQDATGVQEFAYDELGNVTYNRHTYTVPHSSTFTLETEWGYDSWGRIHYITYPDKEIVYYSYDKGGNLQNIRGEKQNQPTVYYKYDYYGQK